MTRVLLINPPTPLEERPNPPLGLAFIAAALEEAGVDVRIVDMVTHPLDRGRLETVLEDFEPHIVGATAVTMTFHGAVRALRDIKAIIPDVLTIMGGPHVTFTPQDTLKQVPELDLIVMGEGDVTIIEVVNELHNGRNWSSVRGLAFRGAGGEVTITPAQDIVDVNELPQPARHLLPLGRYRALKMPISITTARGCPFPCIFCSARDMAGAKIRNRAAKIVVDELEDLAGLGFHQINIADDLFTGRKRHCLAVCDEIIARGLKINWSCYSRVDTINPDMLARMKDAGCTTMAFGIESANEEMLKRVRKGITIPKTIEAVKMCVEAGIDPHCSFILGLPGETQETLQETLAFCEKIKGMGASYGLHLLAPFPGTAVREQMEGFDLKILTDDWSQYHANRAIVETSTVSADQLNAIVDEWTRNFERLLLESHTLDEEQRRVHSESLANLGRILFYHDLMMSAALEECGWWPHEGNVPGDPAALEILAARVCQTGNKSADQALDILTHAHAARHIIRTDSNGCVRWRWNDRLEGVAKPSRTSQLMNAVTECGREAATAAAP
jgi:radical SAM superfamily enzyme YgiQ (UPF0313 family)